jgi:hypothetical protein
MHRSTVVAPNGTSVLDSYRTSYGTFLGWVEEWREGTGVKEEEEGAGGGWVGGREEKGWKAPCYWWWCVQHD